jgi:hypothetical protein
VSGQGVTWCGQVSGNRFQWLPPWAEPLRPFCRNLDGHVRWSGVPVDPGLRRFVVMSVSSEADSEGGQGSAWVGGVAAQGAWPIHSACLVDRSERAEASLAQWER